ncbi:hypothetical protein GHT06_009087 [Daphnia sinensis]|uniref:Uncharacterized protein n=1 Tax=Daphnia sinensis TaxID=1820382 RepID=A0AAD5L4V9_9CRUS|nr:hypothetical protein GHT06_009087 [Daphnia sinensis]
MRLQRKILRLKKELNLVKQIKTECTEGDVWSCFMMDQIRNRLAKSKKGYRWSQEVIRYCIILHGRSPGAYNMLKKSGMVNLPSANTLRSHLGISTLDVGFTDIVKKARPLIAALEALRRRQVSGFMGSEETIAFMLKIVKWFEIHDISNLTQTTLKGLPNKAPCSSVDERLNAINCNVPHLREKQQRKKERFLRPTTVKIPKKRAFDVLLTLCKEDLAVLDELKKPPAYNTGTDCDAKLSTAVTCGFLLLVPDE